MLKNLNEQINNALIENIKITNKDLERFYNNEIESKKREIKLKKHELEMYHQLFNQTYKTNYKLENKLKIETNYAKIYNQQYEKYNMVKNTSLLKLQKQEEILKNLNFYFEQYATANENAINEKTKKLNKEEYEVYMIKNDIINFEFFMSLFISGFCTFINSCKYFSIFYLIFLAFSLFKLFFISWFPMFPLLLQFGL